MELLLIVILLLSLGIAGISIKILSKKDGKFAGTCASQRASAAKDQIGCGLCGKKSDECDKLVNSSS
jgi:hypothetical protein